jgi:hypothetical protein
LRSSGTALPGGRLTAIQRGASWTGDYIAAGVTGIAMDVNNLGTTDLVLQLYFTGPNGTAISSTGVTLPSGAGWTHIVLPAAAGDLTGLIGTVEGALGNVAELRLMHNDTTDFPPSPINGSLAIDNITVVPEPAAVAVMGLAILLSMVRRCGRLN